MGAAAGVRRIGVNWGYHPEDRVRRGGAQAIAQDMDHLRDFTLDAITSLPEVSRVETSLLFRTTTKPVWPDLTEEE